MAGKKDTDPLLGFKKMPDGSKRELGMALAVVVLTVISIAVNASTGGSAVFFVVVAAAMVIALYMFYNISLSDDSRKGTAGRAGRKRR